MVKVNGVGFVSNSSSTSYFVMWTDRPIDTVKNGTPGAENCASTSALADELDGLPPECRKGPSGCAEHSITADEAMMSMFRRIPARPPRPEGELYVCKECTTRCNSWLERVTPWVRVQRAKVTGAPSPSGHSRGAPKAPKFVKSFLSAIGSSKPTVSTTNTFVLGKDLLGCIFKRVILIWEQHYSQAYYDCVNSTPYEVQIARMDKGLPEIELRPEHYLPIQSRTPNSAEEVLEATRTLLSLSTVCKSWREAALDDPVWLDVVKESLVRAYIPGSSPAATTTTTGSTKTGEPVIPLAHVTTCRELAMRVSRHTVARGVLPVRKWAPNYSLVLQHLPCGNDVFDFIKGCKTGTIISEGQCVIGGGNPSLDYWRRNAKLIAQL